MSGSPNVSASSCAPEFSERVYGSTATSAARRNIWTSPAGMARVQQYGRVDRGALQRLRDSLLVGRAASDDEPARSLVIETIHASRSSSRPLYGRIAPMTT